MPLESRGRPYLRVGPPRPLWRHVLWALPAALVPSITMVLVVDTWIRAPLQDATGVALTDPPALEPSIGTLLAVVGFAPVVESFGVAMLAALLFRVSGRHGLACAIAGVLWGLLHGTEGSLWFFGTAWSFVVFTHLYLNWRVRSFWHGYAAAWAPHAIINAIAMALAALGA